MLLDTSALFLSWFAVRLAHRKPNAQMTYGYHRFQVLTALINALALVVLIIWIFIEALSRIFNPEPLLPIPVLIIAIAGLIVNIIVFRNLHGSDSLNIRSAALHVLGDLLGSASAIIVAVIVLLYDWHLADPILAIVIAVILSRGTWRILKESSHILLEGTPENIDISKISSTLMTSVTGLQDIHHVHVWALKDKTPLISLHAMVSENLDEQSVAGHIKSVLNDEFNISHSTIQIERGVCLDA